MKTLQDVIISRRSIRKYTSDPINHEQIESLLEAAMYTPSANNLQPWHFIVVNEREMLNKIMLAHPYANMLKDAPLAIVVCADAAIEKMEGYWVQDCSAATQNILLAAHAMELGSVWLGVYPREERMKAFSALFKLPNNIHVLSIIAIGHPKEQKPIPARYIKERIHINQW